VAPVTVPGPVGIAITTTADVERARRAARALARTHGFSGVDAERLVLAVSELGMNLVRYAQDGEIILTVHAADDRTAIEVESRDRGPGIPNIPRALEDGFSTGGGLGNGLPAVRRLLDEFTIESDPNGTRVTARLCPNDR
jgi:serine/threonine-protein kinase RsbT